MARKLLPPQELDRIREAMAEKYGSPETVTGADDVRRLIGSQGKRDLARRFAAERGISEKSARDTLTRYEKGTRRPAAGTLGSLTDAANKPRRDKIAADIRRQSSVTLSMRVRFIISAGTIERTGHPSISGRDKTLLSNAIEQEDPAAIYRVFMRGYDGNNGRLGSIVEGATILEVRID